MEKDETVLLRGEAETGKEEDFIEKFQHLQDLADQGKLCVIFDGLDELGEITKPDILNVKYAAPHKALEVNMKTACVGILNGEILPGANVVATGRNT